MTTSQDPEIARKLQRLAALEETMSTLRHDIRGMLAPALLVTDRLLAHADPKVVRAGETVMKAVRRAEERLNATRPGDQHPSGCAVPPWGDFTASHAFCGHGDATISPMRLLPPLDWS